MCVCLKKYLAERVHHGKNLLNLLPKSLTWMESACVLSFSQEDWLERGWWSSFRRACCFRDTVFFGQFMRDYTYVQRLMLNWFFNVAWLWLTSILLSDMTIKIVVFTTVIYVYACVCMYISLVLLLSEFSTYIYTYAYMHVYMIILAFDIDFNSTYIAIHLRICM